MIGKGGCGKVYKGELDSKELVAVKCLNRVDLLQGSDTFLAEVTSLSHTDHPNIIKLIGVCNEDEHRILVYEFMPRKSLGDQIQSLDWKTRMDIAMGTARGLAYLHNLAPPIIHRDLKSDNILLGEGHHPKISDFGLAYQCANRNGVTTKVMGTEGYRDPDYEKTGKLTIGSDIYSFGVVLLEIISGKKVYDPIDKRGTSLIQWAKKILREPNGHKMLVDPALRSQYSKMGLIEAVALVEKCIRAKVEERPNAAVVVKALESIVSQ